MRNVKQTLAILALGVSAFGCATGSHEPEPTTKAPQSADATGQGTLAITSQSDYHVVGTWVYADTLVQFESHVSEEGVSTVKLTVNGAEFDNTFDYFSHAWTADGHKNTLFRTELDALLKLEGHLDGEGKLGRPWERLFSSVSQHGAAPAGHTFLKREGSPGTKEIREEVQHREANSVSNDGITYRCSGDNGANYSNSWGKTWAEHDSFGGEGATNSTAGNANHEKMWIEAPGGCRVGRAASSGGNGRGSCEGRCGAGCPRTYNFYFTLDCMDHDVCLDSHPAASTTSYSGDCGYEFSDADGDWAGGTSSGYYWGCPGSTPSNCEESGNSIGSGTLRSRSGCARQKG